MVSTEYCKDESFYTGQAVELVYAGQTGELQSLVAGRKAVTLQGSRTGVSGCCVALTGSVLNLSRLKKAPEFGHDEIGYYVDVLPGLTIEELEKAIAREGLKHVRLPFSPTEKSSSLGGVYALNAQGPAPLAKYHVSDYLLEAELFFPAFGWITVGKGDYVFDASGTLSVGNATLSAEGLQLPAYLPVSVLTPYPGMDLLELFCGSEGMIGIAGRMRIRLAASPAHVWKILCFAAKEDAFALAAEIKRQSAGWKGVFLQACDLMDDNSVALINKQKQEFDRYQMIPPLPEEPVFALFLELSAEEEEHIDAVLEELLVCFEQHGIAEERVWAADSVQDKEVLDIFRHAVPESINAEIEQNRRQQQTPTSDIRKVALDVQSFRLLPEEVLSFVQTTWPEYAMTVHLGRGVYHIDLFAKTEVQMKQALQAKALLFDFFLRHQSLFAAENGFGKGKYEAFLDKLPAAQRQMIDRVRDFFDPRRQLNPGNLW